MYRCKGAAILPETLYCKTKQLQIPQNIYFTSDQIVVGRVKVDIFNE